MSRKILGSAIPAVLISVFISIPHGGFFLFFAAPILFVWVLVRAFLARRNRADLRFVLQVGSIWLISLSASATIHWYRAYEIRKTAESIVVLVQSFKSQNGRYPRELGEVLRPLTTREFFYDNSPDHTVLFYPSTFFPFVVCSYNFSTHSWSSRD